MKTLYERNMMDSTDNNQIEDAAFEELDTEVSTDNTDPDADASGQDHSLPGIYPTQVVLTIRTIVGGYLMYLAYQIITSGNPINAFMWIAVGIFIIAGAALVIMSVKHFICGEYEGGKKDENR